MFRASGKVWEKLEKKCDFVGEVPFLPKCVRKCNFAPKV